ncbi:uncharacterized protein LOC131239494 isoform X1 [Magnolia sinica]|uniref:uncharacterized protein LOC131239494 isoform X1 n=1 Tax=Magnolia sinica TaxID=86752 RepID=UPI00265A5836|nr:uncharacterized protein LOC131239494 isoform X1 [Magnolia sinica]
MGLFLILQLYVCLVMSVLQLGRSDVFVRLDRVPAPRTRFSTAIFRYTVEGTDGRNPCRNHGCSIYCEIDGRPLKSCPIRSITLKNLTENRDHCFLLNVTTSAGERNSSAYKWYIDTIPPTASVISKASFTNAANVTVEIAFSEACTGQGGFKCENASSCDVMVNGPATVDASTLKMLQTNIKYSVVVDLSMSSIYGRVVVKMAEKFCADQAGNLFKRTNRSIAVVRFDRRPVHADMWTLVPAYELEIGKMLRTVFATNKTEDLEIFLEFSDPVVNSTKDILSVLHANVGNLVPIHSGIHGVRRFGFKLQNVSGTEIITIKLQSNSLIGRSGTVVSPVAPIIFLYDSMKPSVRLSSGSRRVTKESNINVIVEFTKPVFGFDASAIEVDGGRLARFKELSRALYSLTVSDVSQSVVSVLVPDGKASDIAGNLNSASNQLEVRHYSVPAISVALHSFVTAGLLATSLAAAVLALSSANLAAIGGLTSGATNIAISDPSRNILGTFGHLQVFVFSDWISVSLPIEYSETIKGLRWLIPREKLPWKHEDTHVWPTYPSYEGPTKPSMRYKGLFGEFSRNPKGLQYASSLDSSCITSLFKQQMPTASDGTTLPIFQKHYRCPGQPAEVLTSSYADPCKSEIGGLHRQKNVSMKDTPYGLPLDSAEYFIYFLRGEPLSAANVVKSMENHTGWEDFKMNMFWLGVASGGLLTMHLLVLVFLRWRTGTSVHGILSVPRFELFLLILMLPCMCQSSAFVIRGGTTEGIIAGSLLLAVPAALLLSVCLFLIVAIFMGSFVQYKEVKRADANDPWHTKLLFFFTGKPTIGKWFHWEGLPPSFLPRFGILFEDRKGPPVFISVDRNDPSSTPEWTNSGQSGIGRMRAIISDDGQGEAKIPTSGRLLGCARSAYLILDLLRKVGLGIISGAYSSTDQSHGQSQCIIALGITSVQFLYLFFLKPYIRTGVQVTEGASLLCEAAIFVLSFYNNRWNGFKYEKSMGRVMLALLFTSFACQLVNEWYALINCLLRLPQSQNPSFKLGLKWVAKGLILPFLPRKHWSRLVPKSSQPKTGLAPVVPLCPETELERRDMGGPRVDPLSAMTATVVPMYSPRSSPITDQQAMTASASAQAAVEINVGSSSQSELPPIQRRRSRSGEGKQLKGLKESKAELKMLQEMAKASFSGGRRRGKQPSTSYSPREQCSSDESSADDSEDYFPRNMN